MTFGGPMSETVNGGNSGDIHKIHMYSYPTAQIMFLEHLSISANFTVGGPITLNRRDFPRRSPRRVHIRSKSTKRRHPFARSCMKNMAMIMSTLEANDWFRNPHFFFVFWLVLVLSSIFCFWWDVSWNIWSFTDGEPHGRHGRVP